MSFCFPRPNSLKGTQADHGLSCSLRSSLQSDSKCLGSCASCRPPVSSKYASESLLRCVAKQGHYRQWTYVHIATFPCLKSSSAPFESHRFGFNKDSARRCNHQLELRHRELGQQQGPWANRCYMYYTQKCHYKRFHAVCAYYGLTDLPVMCIVLHNHSSKRLEEEDTPWPKYDRSLGHPAWTSSKAIAKAGARSNAACAAARGARRRPTVPLAKISKAFDAAAP